MKEIRGCQKCILPETFPGIAFNDGGICNFCLNHETISVLGETKLRETLNTQKGEAYDCIVPISGGKDSTFVLYYAVKTLGLRAIAVNYDSGLQSDLAKENMDNACKILNVPLVVKEADGKNQVKMLREALRISQILGTFFALCGNCENNIRTVCMSTAKTYKVPFILYGSSSFEEYVAERFTFMGIKGFITRIAGRNIVKSLFHMMRYCFYSVRQRMQMKVPIRYRFQPIGVVPFPKKGVRVIHFFNYISWDSINKTSLLKEKLGWRSPADREARFDCLLHCFGNHHWLQESGISQDGFTYCTMIRGNRMKREDALLKERALKETLEEECLDTIKKIGLEDYVIPGFR